MSSRKPREERITQTLIGSIASAAIGSAFLHGYNLGVVNAPQKVIEAFINATETARSADGVGPQPTFVTLVFSLFVSILCVGGMVGAFLSSPLSAKFGRVGALLISSVFAIAGATAFIVAKPLASYELLIVARFFVGVQSGMAAGLAPVYFAEISPTSYRGAIGTIYQLVVVIAILISQILGFDFLLGNENYWHYLLALVAAPSIVMLITLPCFPESPKYLLTVKGEERLAEQALKRLRGTAAVESELQEIRDEHQNEKKVPKVTLSEMVKNPLYRVPLVIALMIMVAQQLSGINLAIFFSTSIFQTAGMDAQNATLATLGTSVVNILVTIISMGLVEKAGRKTLLLVGFIGMAVCTVILTAALALQEMASWVSYISIIGLMFFVIFFAVGPGSIPWFLVTELFGQGARSLATSLAVAANWVSNIAVGMAFLPMMDVMEHYSFLVFTGLLIFFTVYTMKRLPETRGRTVEEIHRALGLYPANKATQMTQFAA